MQEMWEILHSNNYMKYFNITSYILEIIFTYVVLIAMKFP